MVSNIMSLEYCDDEVWFRLLFITRKAIANPCHKLYSPVLSILWPWRILGGKLLDQHSHLPRFLPYCLQQQLCYCLSNILQNQFMSFYHLTSNGAFQKCNKCEGICHGSYHLSFTCSWTQKGVWKYLDNTRERLWLSWNLNSALEFLLSRNIGPVLQSGVLHL